MRKLFCFDKQAAAKPRGEVETVALAMLRALKGLHYGAGIMGFAHGGWCLLAIETPALKGAGIILFRELERLELLRFCEVAAFHPLLQRFARQINPNQVIFMRSPPSVPLSTAHEGARFLADIPAI